MSRRIPLSPNQSTVFAMGRTLVLLDSWAKVAGSPVEFDRAMLLDFASQHPRLLIRIVPEIDRVVQAHGLHANVRRHLSC